MKALGIIIIALVVGGAAWYGVVKNQKGEEVVTTEDQQVVEEAAGKKKGLAETVLDGGNYQCTFESTAAQVTSKGTVYISEQNLRGDFESIVSAAGSSATRTHLVQKDGYVYSWIDNIPYGVKVKVAATREEQAAAMNASMNLDNGVPFNYDCAPWTPEAARFTLPTGVTFTEATAVPS